MRRSPLIRNPEQGGELKVLRILLIAGSVALAACQPRDPKPAIGMPSAPPPISSDALDLWLGEWIGAEGTSLTVSRQGEVYVLRIRDLDRTTSFQATPVAEGLQFERRGARETVHATDGAGTGMKWLAAKQECLTVRAGEGYCRR